MDLEIRLWKCLAEVSSFDKRELHRFPIDSLTVLMNKSRAFHITLPQYVWSLSLKTFSSLIQIRYHNFDSEMRFLISKVGKSSFSSRKKTLLFELKTFFEYLDSEIHPLVAEQLDLQAPINFQYHMWVLQYLDGTKSIKQLMFEYQSHRKSFMQSFRGNFTRLPITKILEDYALLQMLQFTLNVVESDPIWDIIQTDLSNRTHRYVADISATHQFEEFKTFLSETKWSIWLDFV